MNKKITVKFLMPNEGSPSPANALGVTGQAQLGSLPQAPDPDKLLVARRLVADQVAQQKSDVLELLLQGSVLTLLAVGLLAVGVGYAVAGRALAPLQHVTATARRLSESTLHERIALKGPSDEIKELADTFDAMLDRLHRAFDAQRRFVANASHELRTPLTVNRTVLEVAVASRRSPEETRVLARSLLGNTARHERLIEGLLLLARSERGLDARTPVPLHDAARAALEQLADRAEEADVMITAELAPAVASGDAVLLERCAVNLVENAIKYNAPDGRIRVRTCGEGGAAVLRVENTGQPVDPHDVPTMFEPFRRLRTDRTGSAHGAGLGLSIVRAVVRAHDGLVEAIPRPGGGLVITVRLPAARAAAPTLSGHAHDRTSAAGRAANGETYATAPGRPPYWKARPPGGPYAPGQR
ncbi:HAMP domain-containing histidine kinase [Actinomadura alba]|uniref:histidine kinase n=2 Tax=Actinomadura alba TaxID=406431 RepID=A0ABR7LZP2_9ACTN|nr:HAMP domain-containing histidine kinase [Actinomadura alba]